MTDVKIVVAGIEMTPEQARKVHAELSKLFGQPLLANPSMPKLGIAPHAPDWGKYPIPPYMKRFTPELY